MTAVVTLENVSLRYLSAAEPAISDVSLCDETGELLLLAGPSGCGKSTLMRIVNGLVPIAYRADIAGSVTVGGQDAKGLTIRQFSETVGSLLQDPGRQVVGQERKRNIADHIEALGSVPNT
jgi:energy-coupling factor transporter ATP-binding protein EcfA2